MKAFFSLVLGFFCLSVSAQTNNSQRIIDSTVKEALRVKLQTINDLIDSIHAKKDNQKVLELDLTKAELDSATRIQKEKELKELAKLIKEEDSTILSKCADFTKHKQYLKEFANIHDSILTQFSDRNCRLYGPAPEKPIDYTKFIIIGNNDPVKADELFTNESTKKVFSDVFSIKSETDLGTFEIPGNETFIKFYARSRNRADLFTNDTDEGDFLAITRIKEEEQKKQEQSQKNSTSTKNYELIPDGALFQSIQIELREGGIVDTRLILLSQDRKTQFYFEGTSPVSILHYTRRAAERNFLEYSHHVDTGSEKVYYNQNALSHLRVRYIDVLDYHPNVGSNYVPDDISYTFPSTNDKEATTASRRSYQVINNNNLQHVLDIRTYTDFLGLFGDEANGLFQIEGKADFFIHPFNFPRSALYYLKKVSPYVRYSRFDEDEDFIQATLNTGTSEYELSDKKLELLERSTLEMGLNVNLVNFRAFKESPFWTSFYVPISYNVTNVQTDASLDKVNFNTIGYGLGAEIELKRFNNFGLNLGYELKGYSYIGDYSSENIIEPGFMKTQALKAEIFYFPGLDRSQSVFLRMKSIRDISSGGGDSFFQLQIGYRFTLGVGAVKAK
ncbi:hypothetical protein [Kordia zhangzhouensis]|uniref:hypothetical protein n=1 Tax=Kordia zhangzhouensis TaxID=1620405 RepID=UPI000629A07E|nr:hypothetical protein [Kordia zhangzhouensis]